MNRFSFISFPNLTTERLNLRQLNIEDENEIFALRSDERVLEFIDRPKTNTIEEAREFIHKINDGMAKDESIYWVIALKNNSKLIGTICFWKISKEHSTAAIGYELLPEHQGKGIMQEAVSRIIEYGFHNLKLRSIVAELSPDNLKSVNLLKRNNFKITSNLDNSTSDEKNSDTVIYTLVNNKWYLK